MNMKRQTELQLSDSCTPASVSLSACSVFETQINLFFFRMAGLSFLSVSALLTLTCGGGLLMMKLITTTRFKHVITIDA